MIQKNYVQVGVTAMREPDGKHLPSIPIFIEIERLTKTGLTEFENTALANIAGFFKEKRKESQGSKRNVRKNRS